MSVDMDRNGSNGSDSTPSSSASKMDKSLQFMNSANNERTQNLSVAKDRAQMTATTSMSVVHVALLKSVIENGREGQPYYEASLGLIITCLVLQIIVGIITLYITHLNNYYQKFSSSSFCTDVLGNLCGCKIVDGPTKVKVRKDSHGETLIPHSLFDLKSQSTDLEAALDEAREADGIDAVSKFRCCCCWVTDAVYEDHEYVVLDQFMKWREKIAGVEMKAVSAEEEINFLKQRVFNAKMKVGELQDDLKHETSDSGDDSSRSKQLVADIRNQLKEAEAKREDLERRKQKLVIMTSQGEVLSKYAQHIKDKRILKKVSFWQNFINYMLYLVFILNAFITGLGIASTDYFQEGTSQPSNSQLVISNTSNIY